MRSRPLQIGERQVLGGTADRQPLGFEPRRKLGLVTVDQLAPARITWHDDGQPSRFQRPEGGTAASVRHDGVSPQHGVVQFGRGEQVPAGDADSIIPIEHGRALKEAGGDRVQLVEYPGGDHNSLRETHPEMEATVVEFFRSHLQPP